jgi:dihydroorotase
VVDAGSAGATTFPGFGKYVIERSATRVYALLNISTVGLVPSNEYSDLAFVNPPAATRTIEQNRDVILGIKVRMTPNIVNSQDLEVLRRARQAADAAKVPIMVHIGGGASPLKDILSLLKPGDIVTHALHARSGGILDGNGAVLPEVREASARGIWMDIGHGSGNLSFEVAEKAFRAGFAPDTISSDVHSRNAQGPVYDLATTLSKFMYLGMSLDQVIRCGTATPSKVFRFPGPGVGVLREGNEADLAIFNLEEGQFEFTDSVGQKRIGGRKLTHVTTIRRGTLVQVF